MPSKQCIRGSPTDCSLTRVHLRNSNEHITAFEDAMQIDLVPELPPSGGRETVVTAVDVFSRCLFAYPTSHQDAKFFVKDSINIMTNHVCLPTTLFSHKGSTFVSQVTKVIKEVAGVSGNTLKHATTNHEQTIGMLDGPHASIKLALKIETSERRSLWCKYVSIAVLNYNISYHASIGCEQSRVFDGRILHNVHDLKLGNFPQ